MTETIDTANLRALAENIIAADGPIWWIEQDFRAVKEVLDATIDDARFVAAATPTTILALLGRLAAAEARNATLPDDAARLDYLQQMGATVDLLPGCGEFYPMRFRVGGLHAAVSTDIRTAIDAAIQARAAASISTKGDGHD